jgi:hypothetical protein
MIEEDLVNEYLSEFEKDWLIRREVTGINILNGKGRRIDAVIRSKEHENLTFGIEFKREDLSNFIHFSKWMRQSIIYTQCIWDLKVKTKLCILICPDFHYGNEQTAFVTKRLLGEFGIGFITKKYIDYHKKNEYCIMYKDTKVWSSIYGYNLNAKKWAFDKYLEL